jgi:hypothetical protein
MKVLRFPLQPGETEIKTNARFFRGLAAGVDRNDALCMWAEISGESSVERTLYYTVVGTGEELRDDSQFVATVFDFPYVWHVYRVFKD